MASNPDTKTSTPGDPAHFKFLTRVQNEHSRRSRSFHMVHSPYPFGSSYEFDNATFFKPYISSRLCGRKRLGTIVTTTSGGGKNLGTAAALNHGVAIVGSLIRALLKKLQGKKRNIGHKKQNPGPIIIHGAALPGSMRALLKTW